MARRSNVDVLVAARLYNEEKLSFHAIGQQFGCTGYTVRSRLRAVGVTLREAIPGRRGKTGHNKIVLSAEMSAAAVESYIASPGVAIAEVARKLGVRHYAVRRALVDQGVQIRASKDTVRDRCGANNPNWRADLTPEQRAKRRDQAAQAKWRNLVYARDEYVCQCCEHTSGGNLNAHHIVSHMNSKALRWETDNGITLCRPCHTAFHTKYGYWRNTASQLAHYLSTVNTERARVWSARLRCVTSHEAPSQ